MKSTGVTRSIDKLGRLVLPKELRDTMNLPEGTAMAFFTDADAIIIKKYQPGCEFCNSMSNLIEFGGKHVCGHCRDDMRKGFK